MRIKELRALLNLLPERFDDIEVCVTAAQGLHHVGKAHLEPQRAQRHWFGGLGDLPADRLNRKLVIEGSGGVWYERPTQWTLSGWWPKGAENVGIPFEGDDLDAL